MVHPLNGHTGPVPVSPSGETTPKLPSGQVGQNFNKLLSDRLHEADGVRFSAHARKRIDQRGIELSPRQLASIEQATNRAADKGAREALFLMGELGLVVNIQNRTVLTAMDTDNMREKVFTNIDSAVIIR